MTIPLPEGMWYDIFKGIPFAGNTNLNFAIEYETIPVFARAGSIIPRVEPVNTTDHYSSRRLYLHTYLPQADGNLSGQMYEDDGWSFGAFEDGAYELLDFSGKTDQNQMILNISRSGNGYAGMPESRMVEWVFYGNARAFKEVVVDGRKLETITDSDQNKAGFWLGMDGFWRLRARYDGHEQQIHIGM